jgi:hypothetical protein
MTMMYLKERATRLSMFAIAGVLAMGMAGSVFAQDPTETPGGIVTHPAHIHMGTCAELDPNPAYPLNDVGPRLNDDDELPAAEDTKGSLTAAPVEVSDTEDIEVKFDDLFTAAHAINVHESAQNIQNYIACGDIGGVVLDDKVYVALHEQNDSGYSGIAVVEKDDDDKTQVTIYLTRDLDAVDSPDATPAP